MMRLFLVLSLLLAFVTPQLAVILEEDVARRVTVWMYDATTGFPKTGVTAAATTCRIVKNDMTTSSFTPTASGGTNDWVEIGNGAYDLELTATQLDTAGTFELGCENAGEVSPPTSYDIYPTGSFAVSIGGSPATLSDMWNYLRASVTDPNGIGYWLKTNSDAPTSYLGVIRTATAQAGAATTITLDASASATDSFYNRKRLIVMAGTGAGQSALITAYVGSTKVATIFCEGTTAGSWRTNPASDSVFVILPTNR